MRIVVCKSHTIRVSSLLSKLRLDLHGVLHMVLQRRPPILHSRSCAASRQLRQILIETLHLRLHQLLLALCSSRSRLQTLALDLRLSGLYLTVRPRFPKPGQRIGERFEIGYELLVWAPPLLRLCGRLLDFTDERRVLDFLSVFLRRP